MFLVSWYIGLAYPANWLRSRPLIRYIMKIFDFFLPVGLHNIDAIKKLANKIIFSTFSRSNFKKSLSQTVIAVNFYPRKTFFKLFFETFFFDGPTSAAPMICYDSKGRVSNNGRGFIYLSGTCSVCLSVVPVCEWFRVRRLPVLRLQKLTIFCEYTPHLWTRFAT